MKTNLKQHTILVAGVLIFIILATIYTTKIKTEPSLIEAVASHPVDGASVLNWIRTDLCSPPCWEGITPGMPAPIAVSILKQNQDVMSVQFHAIDSGRGEINWVLEGGTDGGRIFYRGPSYNEGSIYAVVPYFECCVELDSVIKLLGDPDYAYTREVRFPTENPSPAVYTYTLLWSSKGIVAKGSPKSGTQINKNFQIDTMIFIEPSIDGFLFYEGNSGKSILSWHGYDDATNYLVP